MFLKRLEVQGYRAAAQSPIACEFGGRFTLVLGANGVGKTTINEAIVLAHRHRFPRMTPFDAAMLGPPPRKIRIEYGFDQSPTDEGALGQMLLARGLPAPTWERPLERSLGRVRAGSPSGATDGQDNVRLVHLPALRNPVDQLSKGDAQVLVELLRAQERRRGATARLADLRAQAEAMLASLTSTPLVNGMERRIADQLRTISGGVQEHHAFIGTQRVDDAYLARVLEVLLASIPDRGYAQRLEASSLGYVNMLHIAVTLAGIPDPGIIAADAGSVSADQQDIDLSEGDRARQRLEDASAIADAASDSFFPDLFHATVLIEEPEAHLHPQLQFGLIRYLRRIVTQRPEIQIIVTTHSGELAGVCDPDELVVLQRDPLGINHSRRLGALPLPDELKRRLFQQTRLHLDASRSASLFADRVLVVEGVTEATLLRVLGRVWAGNANQKASFIDALTIVPVGHKIGEWPIRLLATPGFELVRRVAALADTDRRGDPLPGAASPGWHALLDPDSARFFWSRPTLEPTLVNGNEHLVRQALRSAGIEVPVQITRASVDAIFQDKSDKKGEFALTFAALVDEAPHRAMVPYQIAEVFDWLYEPSAPDEAAESGGEDSDGLAGAVPSASDG